MKRILVSLLLPVVAATLGCQSEGPDGAGGSSTSTPAAADLRTKLLASWATDMFVPQYAAVAREAAALDVAVGAMCAAPTADTLEGARAAWRSVRAPWKRIEIVGFGPFRDAPDRLGPNIDFWPVRVKNIQEVLADTEIAITIDKLGATVKGMPVIEYLLFPPETTDEDLLAKLGPESRECDYLTVIASDLALLAGKLHAAWDPADGNYVAKFTTVGGEEPLYESLHLAVSDITHRMAYTIERARWFKLGRPLGTRNAGTPLPATAESQFSGRSVDDIRDNLRGVELLFFGPGTDGAIGLDHYARDQGHDFSKPVGDRIAAADRALEAIQGPLTKAVFDEPDRVAAAIDKLGDLQVFLQVDVINALSLSPVFNDGDGD